MKVEITPGNLCGTVRAIASKSHAHRLLIAAALAGGSTEVDIRTTSKDIEATRECLAQLTDEIPVLDCGESGSTLRFMLPVTMAIKDEAVFMGSGRLPERPVSPLKEEMEAHGCTFEMSSSAAADASAGSTAGEAREICRISGRLKAGTFTLPGNVSSQYITGLLFALPLLEGDSRIVITSPLESSRYVDMTLDALKQFGIKVDIETNDGCPEYIIGGGQKYTAPDKVSAEGDWSNIAFWVIAGILSEGGGITCTDLSMESLQSDKAVAELAEEMGGKLSISGSELRVSRGQLNAIKIDASGIPDLVPVMAVAAAAAKGTTHIYNAGRLRIKESDRLAAMYDCLTRVGADITEEPEGLIIRGTGKLKGGTVDGYNDHRIVMAMTVASIIAESPIIIDGAEAVTKSYPSFFEDFKALGGKVRVL